MSEIAKCPICGENPRWFPIVGWESGWKTDMLMCCGYGSTSVKGWSKYAAAMEYAKTTAYWFSLPDGIKHPDDARAEKAMTDAETRVLEVFGK